MREIITIQLGGCGNNIGETFWDLISEEHGVNGSTGQIGETTSLQTARLSVYFNAGGQQDVHARALVIDTDSYSGDKIKSSIVGALINPELILNGSEGTGNNFAKGIKETALHERISNTIRREMDKTEASQGFHILHSIGGGTGSGLGSLLIQTLADNYPKQLTSTFTVFPSKLISNVIVEPYNSVLSMPQLIENAQLTFILDNEALYKICVNKLKLGFATMDNVNRIVAYTMSGVTACLRFPGQLNSGLRTIQVNMVPFPALHFLVPGFAPLMSCIDFRYTKINTQELVQQLFDSNRMLADIDFYKGKLLTVATIFRGRVSPVHIDTLMTNIRDKNMSSFVEWIPNSFKTAVCDIPPRGLEMSGTFIGNTTATGGLFKKMAQNFDAMFKTKAHLHWYTGEGMEEQEFKYARDALEDIVQLYTKFEDGPEVNANENNCEACSS